MSWPVREPRRQDASTRQNVNTLFGPIEGIGAEILSQVLAVFPPSRSHKGAAAVEKIRPGRSPKPAYSAAMRR